MGTLKIDRYLEKIIEIDGSDLHVSSGMPPKIRVHGELREISKKPFNNEQVEAL